MKKDFDDLFELDRGNKEEYIQVNTESSTHIRSKHKKNIYIDSSSPATIADYNPLVNKPSIEGVTLIGDKTFEELNFAINLIDCGTSTTVI